MNKKGVTIIELLIYIALFAIVAMLIGKQFKGLVNNYTRGKHTSRQMSEARDILGLMVREIRNTGLKYYFSSGTMSIDNSVYVNTVTDRSSFEFSTGNPGDELTIYKLTLDDAGENEGFEKIRFYLSSSEPHTLKRQLTNSNGTSRSVIAQNVWALQFEYGILGDTETVVPATSLASPSTDWQLGASCSSTGGAITDAITSATTRSIRYNTDFPVTANQKYRATVTAASTAPLDYLAVSIKNGAGTILGTEQFLPYNTSVDIEIPVQASSSQAYAHLDYKTTGAGTITLTTFTMIRSQRSAYTWTPDPTTAQKLQVRAIRIYLLTRTKEKTATVTTGTIHAGGTTGGVDIDCSGEYSWRLYTETVPVPNNGR